MPIASVYEDTNAGKHFGRLSLSRPGVGVWQANPLFPISQEEIGYERLRA